MNVLLISPFLWQHFRCYPRVGLAFNAIDVENIGVLRSGLIFVEPQHDHLSWSGLFPRLGIGVAHAHIPATNSSEVEDADRKEEHHEGYHLCLSYAIVMKRMFNPWLQINSCMGFSYLPSFDRSKDNDLRM